MRRFCRIGVLVLLLGTAAGRAAAAESCIGDCDVQPRLNLRARRLPESTCDSAWAYDPDTGVCFQDIDLNEDGEPDFHNWGWSNGPYKPGNTKSLELWWGAEDCDLSKGTKVGSVDINFNESASRLSVTIDIHPDYHGRVAQVYAGLEKVARFRSEGKLTTSPHLFPRIDETYGSRYQMDIATCLCSVHVLAHVEVCTGPGSPPPTTTTTPNPSPPPPSDLECYAAWARHATQNLCFDDMDPEVYGDLQRWGWTNGPFSPGANEDFEFWALTGACILERGFKVGTANLNYDAAAGTVTVSVAADDPYYLRWFQTYAGIELVSRSKEGVYAILPEHLPRSNTVEGYTGSTVFYISEVGYEDCDIYLIIHTKACVGPPPGAATSSTPAPPVPQVCDRAWARHPSSHTCFREIDENEDGMMDFGIWGWTNGPFEPGTVHRLELWWSATDCQTDLGVKVGYVNVSFTDCDSTVILNIHIDEGFHATAVHAYAGPEIVARDDNGLTVNPGSLPRVDKDFLGNEYVIVMKVCHCAMYVMVNLDVCAGPIPPPMPTTEPPTHAPQPIEWLTTWGRHDSAAATCFHDLDTKIYGDVLPTLRWGWSNGPFSPGTDTTLELWASATRCELSQGKLVGSVHVSYTADGSFLTLTATTNSGYYFLKTQSYVGVEGMPRDRLGEYTENPGAFPRRTPVINVMTYTTVYAVSEIGKDCDVYVVVHGEIMEGAAPSRRRLKRLNQSPSN